MLAVLSHTAPAPAIERSDVEPGFLTLVSRIVHAVHAERQRRRDAHIAEFVARRGGRMTDDLERQIGQHFC